ncbi:MAG: hypothetical protein LC768_01885 [Acidobacteria bacterium]|nr:hypothetical protein [Acidobacteriota bacterium]MCA1637082.1 hypothetical protein [Acidobacteriota bacterium]
MSYPSRKTIKKLFALSGNVCAFPKCPMPLIDEDSGSVIGEMCHIKARNSGGARYDSTQTDEQRDAFENLILMCSIHHKVIDDDEESYSVERLEQIKSNYESRPSSSTELTIEQERLEQILETHIRSIIEKSNFQTNNTETIKEGNYLIKAQRLAREKEHNDFRSKWLYSHETLKDAINSVNEIFSLFDRHFSSNSEIFSKLGIELEIQKTSRVIFTFNFACHILLKGFQEAFSYDNSPSKLSFEIVLFKKKHTFGGYFNTDLINGLYLVPDINFEKQVVWKDKENDSEIYAAKEVSEKCFDLLIVELEKKKPVDETDVGGRYIVDGEEVDAWGDPFEN